MTRYQLIEVLSRGVRNAAEAEFRKNRRLVNRCLLVSFCFSTLLRGCDVENDLVGGYFITGPVIPPRLEFGDLEIKREMASRAYHAHCWIEIEQSIWDLTASQFDSHLPPVAVFEKPHDRYVERYVERVRHVRDLNFARAILQGWGLEENAHSILYRVEKGLRKSA